MTTHVENSRLLLRTQWYDNEAVYSLLASICQELDDIEVVLAVLDNILDMNSTASLNVVGGMLGVTRGSSNDVEYKERIQLRIKTNRATPDVNSVYEILAEYFASNFPTVYTIPYSASCVIHLSFFTTGTLTEEDLRLFRTLIVPGVKIYVITEESITDTFGLAELGTDQYPPRQMGFSEDGINEGYFSDMIIL